MIKYIFTANTVTLTLTDYESQNYICSVHFLVLDSDILSWCYVWKDFFFRIVYLISHVEHATIPNELIREIRYMVDPGR